MSTRRVVVYYKSKDTRGRWFYGRRKMVSTCTGQFVQAPNGRQLGVTKVSCNGHARWAGWLDPATQSNTPLYSVSCTPLAR